MNDIDRVIKEGYTAIDCLRRAKLSLDSARSWGTLDILGGGLISSLVKHSKMDDAKNHIRAAEQAVMVFNDSIMKLNLERINVDTKDLLGFLDVFCDGLFMDLLMQSRINEARESVDKAINQIHIVISKLEREKGSRN